METKFKQAVYETGKSLSELSREYANNNGTTEQAAYAQGKRFFDNGVKYYTPTSINWAELLGKAFREIKED